MMLKKNFIIQKNEIIIFKSNSSTVFYANEYLQRNDQL